MKIEFKNAIFTDYQIIIKMRNQNISIPFIKIDRLLYAKPTFRNYLLLGIFDCKTVGVLYIYLKEKINNRKKYCFFIKYDDLINIPKKAFEKIMFYSPGTLWG